MSEGKTQASAARTATGHVDQLQSRSHLGINTALLRQDIIVWAQGHPEMDLQLPDHSWLLSLSLESWQRGSQMF